MFDADASSYTDLLALPGRGGSKAAYNSAHTHEQLNNFFPDAGKLENGAETGDAVQSFFTSIQRVSVCTKTKVLHKSLDSVIVNNICLFSQAPTRRTRSTTSRRRERPRGEWNCLYVRVFEIKLYHI